MASTLNGSASGSSGGPNPKAVATARFHMSPLEPAPEPALPFTEFVWRMKLTFELLSSGAVHSTVQDRWLLPSSVCVISLGEFSWVVESRLVNEPSLTHRLNPPTFRLPSVPGPPVNDTVSVKVSNPLYESGTPSIVAVTESLGADSWQVQPSSAWSYLIPVGNDVTLGNITITIAKIVSITSLRERTEFLSMGSPSHSH